MQRPDGVRPAAPAPAPAEPAPARRARGPLNRECVKLSVRCESGIPLAGLPRASHPRSARSRAASRSRRGDCGSACAAGRAAGRALAWRARPGSDEKAGAPEQIELDSLCLVELLQLSFSSCNIYVSPCYPTKPPECRAEPVKMKIHFFLCYLFVLLFYCVVVFFFIYFSFRCFFFGPLGEQLGYFA